MKGLVLPFTELNILGKPGSLPQTHLMTKTKTFLALFYIDFESSQVKLSFSSRVLSFSSRPNDVS
jgi:hypothetical protein